MTVVYQIRNKYSGRVYVGSTVDYTARKSKHLCMLRKGDHRNRRLQKDYEIYGMGAFVFEVLEEVPCKAERYEREQFWIDCLSDNLYNILPNAGRALGRVHIEPTKRKVSESSKGRRPSEATLLASAKSRRGRPLPEETRLKMSESHKRRDARGSRSSNAKLTESNVADILDRLYAGDLQKDIAEEYGVAKSTISHISQGNTWTNVPRKGARVCPTA